MEAANLSVSITGDASGLLSAVGTANTALTGLSEAAERALKDKDIKITAVDDTASGVAAARAAINSLSDKTVTVTVDYRTTGSAMNMFARGTYSAPRGLALVNDERGVSDPRELIYHNGHYMMYQGRDVIVPLDRGDRVYTAEQTKAILSAMGIPSYARGLKNEWFEMQKSDFISRTKSSNVPIEEQIEWWRQAVRDFAYDYEVVKECNEEIFSLTRKLVDNINDISDIYIDERTYFNDWESFGDSAVDAFARVKENNRQFLDEGYITYSEYVENVKRAGEALYEGRIKQSERWLKQQMNYNDMSVDEYIEGLERMAEYTKEYFANGLIDYREYTEGLQDINNAIYNTRAKQEAELAAAFTKQNAEEYAHWEKDAVNWKKMRDTYGDWESYDDSPVKFYERCIERVREFYEAGKIGWQEYMDDTFEYELQLYKAQEAAIEQSLQDRRNYIAELKSKFKAEEAALKASWKAEDRSADMADIRSQLDVYRYAVTERGKNKYEELQTELKQLEREEEIAELEAEHNRIIEKLEKELSIAEANKKGLLTSINSYGMSTNELVSGILKDTKNMRDFLSEMFEEVIDAIKSGSKSNSYTDNSENNYYNVDSGVKSALEALKSSVKRNFMYSL